MRYVPDFSRIEDADDEPLVVHRRGDVSGSALIVLIHGLGGDRYGTWTPRKSKPTETSLPRFLYDDVPVLDVGLYRYRTLLSRLKFWKSIELEEEATVLADRLRDQADTYGTLILAGHSMGGILARAAVCELLHRNDIKTLKAIKGILLLASPQAGSLRVPWIARFMSADFRALSPHNRLLANAEQMFTDRIVAEAPQLTSGKFLIPAYMVAGAEDNWVDRFSAGLSIPSERRNTVRGSHVSAVKPKRRTDDGYVWVLKHIRSIVSTIAASDDPFDACELGGKLFINRKLLRSAIRDITTDGGKTRILAVKGPPRSGKSHSIYFIEHIQCLGKYEKAVIRLDDIQAPASFTPKDLAESLLLQIGRDATHVPEEANTSVVSTRTRWIGRIADYIVGQIKAQQKTVFIVLDGFTHRSLPQPTSELVRELVKRADTEPKLRIALLDFTEDLLSPQVSDRSATEPIANFTAEDLRTFFVTYAHAAGRLLPPESLNVILSDTLDSASANANASNESVAERVKHWIEKLRATL